MLIKAGADINAPNLGGITPLHLAAKHNRVKMVEFLCQAGANIRSLSVDGKTPLFYNTYSCKEILIQHHLSSLILALNILFSNNNQTFGQLPPEIACLILQLLPENDNLYFYNVFNVYQHVLQASSSHISESNENNSTENNNSDASENNDSDSSEESNESQKIKATMRKV